MLYSCRVSIQRSERIFRVCANCGEANVAQRTDPARHHHRRHYHAGVHSRERVPGPEGWSNLRDLDPGSRHFDGSSALLGRSHGPGEQHRSDDCVGGGHAVGGHLRSPRPRDCGLVERFPVLGDHVRVCGRRFVGRHVLDSFASRARDGFGPAIPRGCGRR